MSSEQFLYPTSRQFPFDNACEKIVRTLEQRQWKAPGITVGFRTYGPGYQIVDRIEGNDFLLKFGRPQRRLGQWNDVAAIHEITIPTGKQLRVYNDESGPTLYVYVGKNLQRDRARFASGSKVLSRAHDEKRWYLKYTGVCRCGSTGDHKPPRRRSPILAHNNDLGREYDPQGNEPLEYTTSRVFAEFTRWLTTDNRLRAFAR